jgi:hypothetical protein
MKPTTVARPATTRPNRILVLLAAAWMVLSLAIGGALAAEERTSATPPTEAVTGVSQP